MEDELSSHEEIKEPGQAAAHDTAKRGGVCLGQGPGRCQLVERFGWKRQCLSLLSLLVGWALGNVLFRSG